MNVSQLKAFLGDNPQHLGNKNSIENQLRDAGLKQAIAGQNNRNSQTIDKFSSSTSIGVRIYANSFNATLEINKHKPDFSAPESEESTASLFDFEEVAKNVLNFVSGAIKHAQNKGADENELNDLFEQASSGVLKGIKLAEKDLAGFLNEEITNGISQSKNLIEEGIASLRRDIFEPLTTDVSPSENALTNSTSVSYEKYQTGQLNIRTRDGDSVNIRFDEAHKFALSHDEVYTPEQQSDEKPRDTVTKPHKTPIEQTSSESSEVKPVSTDPQIPEIESESEPGITGAQIETNIVNTEQNVVVFQESSFSFSVEGELDENELKAIGQLVVDANDLAEEFFNGDIETAFNQALELGYDEQELSSFALQLTKAENTEVIKAYETVSRFDRENVENEPAKAVKPVAEYLDKLLNVLDGSRLQLENSKSYENMINELINKLGEEVATPDLISAINRFNEFNQKLVNNLPIGYQPENNT